MKHKLVSIAVALLFILAAAVAFYPPVSNSLAERNRSIVRTEYTEQIEQTDDAKLAAILAAAREYNAALQSRSRRHHRVHAGGLVQRRYHHR